MTYTEALLRIGKLPEAKRNSKGAVIKAVGEEMFKELAVLGLIQEGIDVNYDGTCSLTKSGAKRLKDALSEPSPEDVRLGKYLATHKWAL
jgi:hypothetical protein